MKKLSLLIVFIFASAFAFAQAPLEMKYQGVARNTSGTPLANTSLNVRITIHQGTAVGPNIYQETQNAVMTNQFGLFNINIGSVTPMNTVTWGDGFDKFMEVEVDFGSGFVSMGTSQLLSVPYALYALSSGSPAATGPTGATGPAGANGVTGATGFDGPTGPMGPAGTNGANGATGPTGAAGINGATGAAGANGATGAAGANGATGAAGANGATGAAGANGATGAAGPTGANGAAGATGPTGVAGVAGPTGANGAAGATGPTGANGPVGPTGANGVTGATGSGLIVTSQTGATTVLSTATVNYAGGTITVVAPSAGTIVVEANAFMRLDHATGTDDQLILAIGTTTTDIGNPYEDVYWTIPAAIPTYPTNNLTFTVRRSFVIAAPGTYTYYLNGQMPTGSTANDVFWFAAMEATFYR